MWLWRVVYGLMWPKGMSWPSQRLYACVLDMVQDEHLHGLRLSLLHDRRWDA
jgi:hypothetical protein